VEVYLMAEMESSEHPEYRRPQVRIPTIPRRFLFLLVAAIAIFVSWSVGGEVIWFWLNAQEFGELFIRPIYFQLLGGLILAAIAFARVDIRSRRSLIWWGLTQGLRLARQRGAGELAAPPVYVDFGSFKLTPVKFVLWQVTKVVLGIFFFRSVLFGMAVHGMLQGWDLQLGLIWNIFKLPFITPPADPSYAQVNVISLVPALTLIVSPLLAAIGTRLMFLVGLTHVIRIMSPTTTTASRVATIEGLVSLALFWMMFNSFFSSFIDYNTRYLIGGLGTAAAALAVFAVLDWRRRRGLMMLTRRRVYIRVGAVFLLLLIATSAMAINTSIADPKKVEWLGPYTQQLINVNRYFAQLDNVSEVPYQFALNPVPADRIAAYTADHAELLTKTRLWDWGAGFAKLKPEIGLIPYIDYEDSDIIRFNGTLYWAASMKPVLPETVLESDRWYAEHLVYTNVPNGFLILDAHEGKIVDTGEFFDQRRIYYGEGGLLEETWSAFPVGRTESDELDGYFYDGSGGVDLPPPLSWIFEFTFFLAYRDQTIHMIRYRDIYDRMELLLPYFKYPVDTFPVTDGKNTYYMMPLIVELDASKVPWSGGNPIMRLVGYSLIDVYNGKFQIVVLGDDYFSQLFKTAYSDYVTDQVPEWLWSQVRYPEELFEWRASMYNYFHVTDPATYIVAKEFFEVPEGLDTYYIMARPPGFDKPEFLGLLSLELRGALGRNLAGYMVVRNDYPHLGEMVFYEVSLEAKTKLLGPTGALEALEKNSEFAQLKTLLRNPRIGDNILYRVGDHDVYFIPVYTAAAGGVVTELAVVAVVGAAFTGEYQVGLGETSQEAFEAYLAQLSGIERPETVAKSLEERKMDLVEVFESYGLTVAEPTMLNPSAAFLEGSATYVSVDQWNSTKALLDSFTQNWALTADKVLMWQEGSEVHFGVLIDINGVVELHYITVQLES
jgi:hypothetical protein